MRRRDTSMIRRPLAFLMTFALLTGSLLPLQAEAQDVTEGTDYGLNNPRGSLPKIWDCIYFGNYWQRDTNDDGIADQEDSKEPILWRVLSVDGDDAFLLSDRNLEVKKYNELASDQVTWETSTMRSWLNGYDADANQCNIDYSEDNFLDHAFSASEQDAIRETNVNNRDNWVYNTEGGNDTTDKVYLLSLVEAITEKYGFSTAIANFTETRRAKDTDYVWEMQRYLEIGCMNSTYRQDQWWLRSPGREASDLDKDAYGEGPYPSNRAVVLRQGDRPQECGYINADGDYATSDTWCVRPVLHIDLSKDSCWTYAGTVSSSGEENLLPAPVPEETPKRSVQPVQPSDPPFSGENDMPVPPVTGSDGITTWDCIYFGRYWQSDTNQDGTADRKDEKEKIKWRVLSVDGDDALLLADKIIAYQPYNETWVDVTWATSTMRSWLNGYGADANAYGKDYTHNSFLNHAFSASEQSAIRDTALLNEDNEEDGVEGGEDTTDKVYLLSKGDMDNFSYGFWDDYDETKPGKPVRSRYAETTEYVRAREIMYKYAWWLRSPADKSTSACYVSSWGYVDQSEGFVDSVRIAVRPALHLDLSCCPYWENAGQVTSDGKVTTPETPTPDTTPTAEPSVSPTVKPSAGQKPTNVPGATGNPSETPDGSDETDVGERVIYDAAVFASFEGRTKEEVGRRYGEAMYAGKSYINSDSSTWYESAYSLEHPYAAGKLTEDTHKTMTAMTDFYRWLAGVKPLQAASEHSDKLQAEALVRNFEFNHAISDSSKPEDMTQEFWDYGAKDYLHTILARYSTPQNAVTSWINEGYTISYGGWDTVGHRYALIGATVSDVQFGYAGNIAIGQEKAYDNTVENPFSAFPAPGYMPNDLVRSNSSAWSIQLDRSRITVADNSSVAVKVTDTDTGESYECTQANGKLRASKSSSLLVFVQPVLDSGKRYEDSYRVDVTGLTDVGTGGEAVITYTTEFFDPTEYTPSYVEAVTADGIEKFILYKSTATTENLKKIACVLPEEVTVIAENGRKAQIPVKGKWVLNEKEQCWVNEADETKLPSDLTDREKVLEKCAIYYEISNSEYDSYNSLTISPREGKAGEEAQMHVFLSLLSADTSAIFQLVP